jgi:hypothetical protein
MSSAQCTLASSFLLILIAAGSKKYAISNPSFNIYFALHEADFSIQLHLLMLNTNLELLHSSLSCTFFRGVFVHIVPNSALFNTVQVTQKEVALKCRFLMLGHGISETLFHSTCVKQYGHLNFPLRLLSFISGRDNLNPNYFLVNSLHDMHKIT